MEYNSISNTTIFNVNNVYVAINFVFSVLLTLKSCQTKLKLGIFTLFVKIVIFLCTIYICQLSFNDSLYVSWLSGNTVCKEFKLSFYRTLAEKNNGTETIFISNVSTCSGESARNILQNEGCIKKESELQNQIETVVEENQRTRTILSRERKKQSDVFNQLKIEKNNEWENSIHLFLDKLLECMDKIQEWMENLEKQWVLNIYSEWIDSMSTQRIAYIDSWVAQISSKWKNNMDKFMQNKLCFKSQYAPEGEENKEKQLLTHENIQDENSSDLVKKKESKLEGTSDKERYLKQKIALGKEELKIMKEVKKRDLTAIEQRIFHKKKELTSYKNNNTLTKKSFRKKIELAEYELFRYWKEKTERTWKRKIDEWLKNTEKYMKHIEMCMSEMEESHVRSLLEEWAKDIYDFVDIIDHSWMDEMGELIKNIENLWMEKIDEEWNKIINRSANWKDLKVLESILRKENMHLERKKKEWNEKKRKKKIELGMKSSDNNNAHEKSLVLNAKIARFKLIVSCINIDDVKNKKEKKKESKEKKKERNKKKEMEKMIKENEEKVKEKVEKRREKSEKKIEEEAIEIVNMQWEQQNISENSKSTWERWLQKEIKWDNMSNEEKKDWSDSDELVWKVFIDTAKIFYKTWGKWEDLLKIEDERSQSIKNNWNNLKEVLKKEVLTSKKFDESDWTKPHGEMEWKCLDQTMWVMEKLKEVDYNINLIQKEMQDVKENKRFISMLKKCQKETIYKFKDEHRNLEDWLSVDSRWETSLSNDLNEVASSSNKCEIQRSETWSKLIMWLHKKDNEWKIWFLENIKKMDEWKKRDIRKGDIGLLSEKQELERLINTEYISHKEFFDAIKKDQKGIIDKHFKELEELLHHDVILKKIVERQLKTWKKWSDVDNNERNWDKLKEYLRNDEDHLKRLEESLNNFEERKRYLLEWFDRDPCTWDDKIKSLGIKVEEWKALIESIENNQKTWENRKSKWSEISNNSDKELENSLNTVDCYLEFVKEERNMLKELLIKNSKEMLELFIWIESKRRMESLINEKIIEDIENWKLWKKLKSKEWKSKYNNSLMKNMVRNLFKVLWLIDKNTVQKIEDAAGSDVKLVRLNKRYVYPIRPLLKSIISLYNDTYKGTTTNLDEIFKSQEWTTWKELKELKKLDDMLKESSNKMTKIYEELQSKIDIKENNGKRK